MRRDYFRQPKIYATTPREKEYHKLRVSLFLGFSVLLFLFVVWFFFFSSYFKIKKIIISGSLNPEVYEEINRFQGRNILFFRVGKVSKELAQKQTSIASLEIYKGLPDTIKVKVNVRIPKIAWSSQGKTFLIDENGIAFELGGGRASTEEGEQIPTVIDSKDAPIEPGNQVVTPDFVLFILDLSNNFEGKIGPKITELKISETTFQIEVVTDQGWRVYFDTTRDLNNQLIALKKILDQYRDQIQEYVDLRVEGKVYYK